MSLNRTATWIVSGALLLIDPMRGEPTASHAQDTAMTEPTDAEFPPLKDVTLRIDDRPLVITVADARQIARALQRYLDAHEATGDGMPLPRAAGQPWVDTRGALRIGTWILESRADRLVLTMRSVPQPGATSGSQLIAAVARIENDWRVDEITLARIRYR